RSKESEPILLFMAVQETDFCEISPALSPSVYRSEVNPLRTLMSSSRALAVPDSHVASSQELWQEQGILPRIATRVVAEIWHGTASIPSLSQVSAILPRFAT